MTSPVAAIGVTYDGTDLQQSDLGLFLEIVTGLWEGPEVRGQDVVVPSLAGRIPRNRVGDYRRIELRGHVQGQGADTDARRTDYVGKLDILVDLFDPTRDPAALVATMPDGTQRTIDCRPLPSLAIVPGAYMEWSGVSVVLESVDPNWSAVGS